ncbi:MAG: type II secretion system F family protein [Mycobacterium sp.]
MSAVPVLLGLAVLAGPGPSTVRARAGLRRRAQSARERTAVETDVLALASSLDVLALCLTAGMTISGAATATAGSAPPQLARILRRGASLLVLGAEPATAWSAPPDGSPGTVDPPTAAVLRLARRSGSSGAALAEGFSELAAQCRHDASHAATAAAERAGVLIAGPLGLCFLPAFVCLGIVPVVAGLAADVLRAGLL